MIGAVGKGQWAEWVKRRWIQSLIINIVIFQSGFFHLSIYFIGANIPKSDHQQFVICFALFEKYIYVVVIIKNIHKFPIFHLLARDGGKNEITINTYIRQ